jgi:multiple sugar transport system permease protein
MRSGIAATTAIIVLLVYGQFLIPLLLASSASTTPVTVLITNFVGKYSTDYPLVAAGGVLALIPPAIVALALNRHIRGMLSGST